MITDTSTSHGRAGFPRRRLVCDDCGKKSREVPAEKGHEGEAQVRRKLTPDGWTYVKNKDRCAACEKKRKEKPVTKTEKPEPNRQPTRADKRQIMEALKEFYDEDKQCYAGGETDATVAELVGDHIMPGWVAQVREEFFGPEGNEEIDNLREEAARLAENMSRKAQEVDTKTKEAIAGLRDLNEMRGDLDGLRKRIEKLKCAVGPKAAHV